jgi:hypothetical protein
VRVILDEAESTWCFLEPIKAHDEALDFATFTKELMDLLFGGVEGEVADVEGCSVFELVFGFGGGFAVEAVVAVAFTSALLHGLLV